MKKLFQFCFLVLVLAIFAVSASALTAKNPEDFIYTIGWDDVAVIGGLADNCKEATEVIIPSTIEGFPVEIIHNYAFENCTNLTRISIPDTVQVIWNGAFYGCSNLL